MNTISHLDHVAIIVKNIEELRPFYEGALGLSISDTVKMADRGIQVAFIQIGQTKLELIEPLHDASEVSNFLSKRGPGLHHIALKTNDIRNQERQLQNHQAQLLYEHSRPGAHNTQVNFIHPKSSGGVLIEIVE